MWDGGARLSLDRSVCIWMLGVGLFTSRLVHAVHLRAVYIWGREEPVPGYRVGQDRRSTREKTAANHKTDTKFLGVFKSLPVFQSYKLQPSCICSMSYIPTKPKPLRALQKQNDNRNKTRLERTRTPCYALKLRGDGRITIGFPFDRYPGRRALPSLQGFDARCVHIPVPTASHKS